MSAAGDRARVSVLVRVPPSVAFRAFTEDIDQWWGRGRKYRMAGDRRGIIHIEPKVGGRLFESFESPSGNRVMESGHVTAWEPPTRIALEWRSPNFAPGETTFVEVLFEESASGTLVTITHTGWASLRPDHPVRHGYDVPEFLRFMGMWWADLLTLLREYVE
jgi:uncharacterized protein YndB with AHSA1/START domain